MITLNKYEMALVLGGNAAEDWGEQAAHDGLQMATQVQNPPVAIAGTCLALMGAASYYGGWAFSGISSFF